MKKLQELGNVSSFTVKKAGSKLKQGRYYKFRIEAPGTCWVYAYTQSGTFARIKVVVE